ncbi:MAG: prepilin-type N-terminal cleavage/methylation domain-containing protein [Lysobacterales bacterium]
MTRSRLTDTRMRARSGSIRYRASRGFTLLELLLAFLVFSLSFATVLEIMSGSMRNTVRARENTEAALTAQSIMDQLGLGIPLEAGFVADGESGDYDWEIVISPYGDQGQNTHTVELAELTGIQLLQIDLDVRWGEPPRDRSSHFSTVRAVIANRDGVR